jgi:hypothetical protein
LSGLSENTQDQERRDMNNDNTRDAAEPSPASAGSQPVAWEIRRSDGALEALTPCVRMSEQILRCIGGGTILPLYRHPQPTLTDEEREALRKVLRRVREDYFAGRFADSVEIAAVIDGLLERTR